MVFAGFNHIEYCLPGTSASTGGTGVIAGVADIDITYVIGSSSQLLAWVFWGCIKIPYTDLLDIKPYVTCG